MLNKPTNSIASRSVVVKNLTRTLGFSACLGALGLTTSAHASSQFLEERVIEVEIKTADLATESGMIAVYDRLKTKAKRECRADRAALKILSQSVEACAQDLLWQFVESSKLDSLQDFHQAQTTATTQTLAMNTSTSFKN